MIQSVETEKLRKQLIDFVIRKFYSRQNICDCSDDIVNQAFLEVIGSGNSQKLNFGYLSVVCIHIAFALFKKSSPSSEEADLDCLSFLNSKDIVSEIIQKEDTEEILNSLEVLKQIERIVIFQRYYGDYSFLEIAQKNGIKLNTVLSHHRRALEKLRPRLSEFSCGRSKALPSKSKKCGNFSKLF